MATNINNGETGLSARTKINTAFSELNTAITDITGKQPLDADLTTLASLTATTNNFIVSVASAWASRTPAQVKVTLSLDNLDNTSDANKPVSTAQATAIALKQTADSASTVYDNRRSSATDITLLVSDRNTIITVTNVAGTLFNLPNGLSSSATTGFPIGAVAYCLNHTGSTNSITLTPAGGVTLIGDVTIRVGETTKIRRTNTNEYLREVDIPGGGSLSLLKTAMAFVKADVGLGNADNTSDANKPVSNATQNSLDLKANIAWSAKSGTVLAFDKNAVYGTPGVPESTNVTFNNTGAVLGAQVIMFHDAAGEPTYGAEFKKMTTISTAYNNAAVNIYFFYYFDATNIWFHIQQLP